MVVASTVSAVLQGMGAALFAASDAGANRAVIVAAVITAAGGCISSIVAALIARGVRADVSSNRDQLAEVERLVSAPRRIGATAGEDAPKLLPPDPEPDGG